jgi:hypothetical protein
VSGRRLGGIGCAIWAAVFSLPHVYWGAGGRMGIVATLGSLAVLREPVLAIGGTWGVLVICLVAIAFGLAVAGRPAWAPRRLLLICSILAAVVLGGHGLQIVVEFGLAQLGVLSPPPPPGGMSEVHAQLLIWGPMFLIGGLLFAVCAVSLRASGRTTRGAVRPTI